MSMQETKTKDVTHPTFGAAKVNLVYNRPVDEADFEKIFTTRENANKDHGRRLTAAAFNSAAQAMTTEKISEIKTKEEWLKKVEVTWPGISLAYTPQSGDGITGVEAKERVVAARQTLGARSVKDLTPEER